MWHHLNPTFTPVCIDCYKSYLKENDCNCNYIVYLHSIVWFNTLLAPECKTCYKKHQQNEPTTTNTNN